MPPSTTVPRTVEVSPERLARWVEGFEQRHPGTLVTAVADTVTLRSPDGASATLTAPFPPATLGTDALDDLLRHAAHDRRVGILLVRRGGYAVGIAEGRRLVASKVGSGYVQGRTKAGGWSQQRFARRRANQAQAQYAAAADTAARILLADGPPLEAVVTGGDRSGVAAVLDDARLLALRALVVERVLDVPDPRLRVLEEIPDRARAVRILIDDPEAAT